MILISIIRQTSGGSKMAFLGALIETIIKMVIIGAVAFGGIRLGKSLRDKKDAKKAREQAS